MLLRVFVFSTDPHMLFKQSSVILNFYAASSYHICGNSNITKKKEEREKERKGDLQKGSEVGLSYNLLWPAILDWGKGMGRKRADE